MTLPRKANNNSHFCFSPAQGRVATCTRRLFGKNRQNGTVLSCKFVTASWLHSVHLAELFRFGTRVLHGTVNTAASSCAAAIQVQSTVDLRFVGGASCPSSNRARCRLSGQGEREEIHFFETSPEKNFLHSGASASNCLASTSLASRSRRRRAARRGKLISTSTAQPRLPTKRSWLSWTNCARAGGLKEYPRGVRYSSQGSQRTVIGPSLAALSARLVLSCVGGAVAARRSHKPQVTGSSPVPATRFDRRAA